MNFGLFPCSAFRYQSQMLRYLQLAWMLLVTGCGSIGGGGSAGRDLVPGDPDAPSQVTPREAIAIAERYSRHAWKPFGSNILHGKDRKGVLVNTPDVGHDPQVKRRGWWVPGQVNEGIPYKWGGFDDPASFDDAIAAGHAAGDVSSPGKRRANNSAVSRQAAGVDCSGFVSRCLKLPRVHDTSRLPSVCRKLDSALDLQPGDLLNIPRRHVLLCAGWADPQRKWLYYYETGGGPQYWRPGLKQAPLDRLIALGYTPLRYRGMAHQRVPAGEQPREMLTRSIKSTAEIVPNPTIGEP